MIDEETISSWKVECYKAMLQGSELSEKFAEYLQYVERALVCIFRIPGFQYQQMS